MSPLQDSLFLWEIQLFLGPGDVCVEMSNLPSAGQPCTPFSRMGKLLGQDDPVFQVHEKYYAEVRHHADLAVLENVPEYNMQDMVASHLGRSWPCHTLKVDPRNFGLGCARARSYAITFNEKRLKWDDSCPLSWTLHNLRARPAMQACDFFYLTKPRASLSSSDDT